MENPGRRRWQCLQMVQITNHAMNLFEPCRHYRRVRLCFTNPHFWPEVKVTDCGDDRLCQREQQVSPINLIRTALNLLQEYQRFVEGQRTDRICQQNFLTLKR